MDGAYASHMNEVIIIDARFSYEYKGGHIKGAVNVTNPADLEALLFSAPIPNCIILVHCEFSQHRGPQM